MVRMFSLQKHCYSVLESYMKTDRKKKSGLKWQDLNQTLHFQTVHVPKPWGKFPINSSEPGKNIILNNNTRVLPVLSSQFPTSSSSTRLKVYSQ